MSENTHTIAQRALNGGKNPETVFICDDCGCSDGTVYDITTMAPFPVPPEYLCENCAEKRWYQHQERLMEET